MKITIDLDKGSIADILAYEYQRNGSLPELTTSEIRHAVELHYMGVSESALMRSDPRVTGNTGNDYTDIDAWAKRQAASVAPNLVSPRSGSAVHKGNPRDPRNTLCQPNGRSGRPWATYRETDLPVTCKKCLKK